MPKAKTATKKNAKQLVIDIDTDLAACFISPFRSLRWVGKSEDRYFDREDRQVRKEGVAVQFDNGIAMVEDQEIVAMMIQDKTSFGVDFCIDPADRTGFWKLFRAQYTNEVLAETFPTGIPAALNVEMANNVLAQISQVVGVNKSERGVIHVAKGRVPIMDGGRERLTEEQEAELAKIGD